MMKSAGHALLSSFKPPYCFPPKNCRRLPSNLVSGISTTKSRKIHAYHQKQQRLSNFEMGAEQYLPPWFSVAPMMEWTDNHYRTVARLVSKHAWLWTEMLAAETIIYQEKNLDRFLAFNPDQHPIVLQIGGNNLENLAKATRLANGYGYDEINLNCGCPSPKVAGHGCFGVSLMLDPKFVAEAMSVIAANTDVPVSVKCRIGVDDHDSYRELCEFIHTVSTQSPTRHFVIHSRKALLNGISPADNRKIPPLKYEFYYALLRDFPDLRFTINGGVNSIDEVRAAQNEGAHGVMVGRAAYNNSWALLGNVDTAIYGAPPSTVTRRQVLEKYQVYADSVIGIYGNGKPSLRDIVKPLYGLFWGETGNGVWKRNADSAFHHCKTFKSLMEETISAMPDRVLDAPVDAYSTTCIDKFANSMSLLPLPYTAKEEEQEEELLYA
nr:tRNA-dihydrouridine(20/20a) synthase-like isoform X1 [Tanacetum cinerariifolium]